MQTIQEQRSVETVNYFYTFEFENMPDSGLHFPCNEHGAIDRGKLDPVALQNLDECLEGACDGEPVTFTGVKSYPTYER